MSKHGVAFNIRGTNGSGKTFVALSLLAKSQAVPCHWEGPEGISKIRAYRGNLEGYPIVFLGSYETQNGGADTIPSVDMMVELLHTYMSQPQIVFIEGLLISHSWGCFGKAMDEYLDRTFTAFLDTPLEVCIDRVRQRRIARGQHNEFNPRNIEKDWPRVRSCYEKFYKGKRPCDLIDHRQALKISKNYILSLARRHIGEAHKN